MTRTRIDAAHRKNAALPAKLVGYAKIIWATARGRSTRAICKESGTTKQTVWRWQQRCRKRAIKGLKPEQTRPPGMPLLSNEIKARGLQKP